MNNIHKAGADDAVLVAPLFDAYRQFYGKRADPELAFRFVRDRLVKGESVIFIATNDLGRAIGFTQLYPSFSSVSAGRIFVLNDLFVSPEGRRTGVARALLQAAADFGKAEGALRLTLSTGRDNLAAQALYQNNGWVRDSAYYEYSLAL